MAMTVSALKIYSVVLVLTGAGAWFFRIVRSLEGTALAVTACLACVLWLGNDWSLLPFVGAAFLFVYSVGLRSMVRPLLKLDLWIGSVIATGLILTVAHQGDFLIMEALPIGYAHQDTLFHASIASMIKTYGVASTGLQGLVRIQYHVLSHQFVAALSILSGVRVLETYGIVQVVLLCPMLLCIVTWCACRISPTGPALTVRTWLIVCALLILLKALPAEMWVFNDTYFLSESYTLSLCLLVLALQLMASPTATVGEIVMVGILVILSGLSKGSTGIVAICLLWARALILPGSIGRAKLAVIAALTTAGFAYAMFETVQSASLQVLFNPFFYVQVHSVWREEYRQTISGLMEGGFPGIDVLIKSLIAVALFLVVNFILSLTVFLRRWVIDGSKAIFSHPDSLFSGVAMIVGVVTSFFEIIGGWYFVNPAMFVSLPFLAMIVCRRFENVSATLRRTLQFAVLIGVAFILGQSYHEHTGVFLKSKSWMLQLRGGVSSKETVDVLLKLRDQERGRLVVFERDGSFPKLAPGFMHCAAIPFLYPAITEKAWIGVIECDGKCPFDYYGYPSYFLDQAPLVSAPRQGPLVAPVIPPNVPIVRVSGIGASAS